MAKKNSYQFICEDFNATWDGLFLYDQDLIYLWDKEAYSYRLGTGINK